MKKAFSLIELLISIFLLGLIVTFLYSAIGNLQKTNIIFNQKSQEEQNEQKLLGLLYDDIFLASELEITGLKNSTINLLTSNSIYDIEYPYVSWLVSYEKNTLLRVESVHPFTKMTSDNVNLYHITHIKEDCKRFKIYQSQDRDNILIHIKFKDKEPLIYEFFKPMKTRVSKDANETNQTSPTPAKN